MNEGGDRRAALPWQVGPFRLEQNKTAEFKRSAVWICQPRPCGWWIAQDRFTADQRDRRLSVLRRYSISCGWSGFSVRILAATVNVLHFNICIIFFWKHLMSKKAKHTLNILSWILKLCIIACVESGCPPWRHIKLITSLHDFLFEIIPNDILCYAGQTTACISGQTLATINTAAENRNERAPTSAMAGLAARHPTVAATRRDLGVAFHAASSAFPFKRRERASCGFEVLLFTSTQSRTKSRGANAILGERNPSSGSGRLTREEELGFNVIHDAPRPISDTRTPNRRLNTCQTLQELTVGSRMNSSNGSFFWMCFLK